jgi:adenylate kinase
VAGGQVCYDGRFARMTVVLMGPPGVGKGTQAGRLRGWLGVPHVSTGDILREAVASGSVLGRKARAYVESGELVPDELMGEMIAERLRRPDAGEGFVLDGFPRTIEQVEILDRVLGGLDMRLDRVFMIDADVAEIVRRLAGRRVCPRDGSLYHVDSRRPKSPGICDLCGSALVQRPDDTEEVVRRRLEVYVRQTRPVAEAYRRRGILVEVDGKGDPDAVFERLKAGLPS